MQRKHIIKLDDGPVYLTEDGLMRMKRHLADLKASMPNFIEDTAQAAAQGDRSDNDGYKQAKSLLRRTQGQIWNIEDQLKRVAIIKSGRNESGTVQLGSTVTLETQNGERKIFEVVGSHETNPGHGRISHESPLGKTLLNHAEGDTITIHTVNGEIKYNIIEIR